jgi:hypothetical protein
MLSGNQHFNISTFLIRQEYHTSEAQRCRIEPREKTGASLAQI